MTPLWPPQLLQHLKRIISDLCKLYNLPQHPDVEMLDQPLPAEQVSTGGPAQQALPAHAHLSRCSASFSSRWGSSHVGPGVAPALSEPSPGQGPSGSEDGPLAGSTGGHWGLKFPLGAKNALSV